MSASMILKLKYDNFKIEMVLQSIQMFFSSPFVITIEVLLILF